MSTIELQKPQSAFAEEYTRQAEKLSLERLEDGKTGHQDGDAIEATFITPLDPVIETASGDRLPAVPVEEAHKINFLKDRTEGRKPRRNPMRPRGLSRFDRVNGQQQEAVEKSKTSGKTITKDRLGGAIPPSRTHPLFPPLPLYGPPSTLRNLQCTLFRLTSAILSTCFLLVIVLGALFTAVPTMSGYIWLWLTFRDPNTRRPFWEEEYHRAALRKDEETKWSQHANAEGPMDVTDSGAQSAAHYEPTEGGPDPLICDARYYARRVGLDMEEFKVQTEDGFIITLWHVFDPKEYHGTSKSGRRASSPEVFVEHAAQNSQHGSVQHQYKDGSRRYPVLLMHGLLQSAGAYCVNDDSSLAFFLAKSGYDVWLGNNRCGFHPQHSLLQYSDPRMWAWNIRQMGVMDLPALVSRVLEETGFGRVGLVCHSQGTTQTFVALAKEQRPDLGDKISIFCALAPAVYAGPLIGKMYFKFMRVISPSMFRVFFGIHSFIPLMMFMHRTLPGKLYGAMGYRVFSFLFNWSDTRWDRGLRDRFFLFSPVYVSSESMRWWLGRECFAKQKCVLSTKEEGFIEDEEDEESDEDEKVANDEDAKRLEKQESIVSKQSMEDRSRTAWYNEHVPPMALWVAGSDDLVDGRRLLRRFERGREPNVELVHTRVIDEYEHLDVLWAMDAVEKVAVEVRECIWRSMNDTERRLCRKPLGVDIQLHGEDEDVEDTESVKDEVNL